MGIGPSTPVPVLMLGLDGSGKTTLLYRVKLGRAVDTIPTISFNYETLDQQSSVPTRKTKLELCDVSGSVSGDLFDNADTVCSRRRIQWRSHFYRGKRLLVYVIASDAPERIAEARDELARALFDDDILRSCAVLVLASKQDLPSALAPEALTEQADLRTLLDGRRWKCIGTSTQTGEGLQETVEWLEANK